ncbi:MAG: hypothetical protein QOJ07_3960 [Thermoleophilaceae bacterium]|nr:hypothetical protein [Thermoleophilaceae bacterium]
MGFLKRLINPTESAAAPTERTTTLAASARPMRSALLALNAEREELDPGRAEMDLRALVIDLLRGEVAAPTSDVTRLVRSGIDADAFYDKEIARSWEGLGENQRAARVEQFAGLAAMLEDAGEDERPPNYDQMLATVRTKTLVLSFAFDETYGYIRRIERDEQLG